MPRRGGRPFRPIYHPKAGRRAAKDRQQRYEEDLRRAEERAARDERRTKDRERLRVMARVEPARFLQLVAAGAIFPGPDLIREARERVKPPEGPEPPP